MNIAIGGLGIEVTSADAAFLDVLRGQYANFIDADTPGSIQLGVDLVEEPDPAGSDEDVRVRMDAESWILTRGDFAARYDPARQGVHVRQSPNRHSIDSVIRIVHTLALAREHGFLLHSASAIRNARAFLFAGRSGAGKTTLSASAPHDACLLSDEVSYVRRCGGEFRCFGTPFTGELGTPGANRSAPVEAICFLRQAPENRLIPLEQPETLRLLMANILFFANEPELVRHVFDCAAEFVSRIRAFRLDFAPGDRVWELIQ